MSAAKGENKRRRMASNVVFVANVAGRTIPQKRIAEALAASALFKGLEPASIETLAAQAQYFTTYRGQTLMEEGESAKEIFLILSGRVNIQVETISPHMDVTLTRLGPGEVIGEMGVFENQVRFATVVALDACEMLQLSTSAIRTLADDNPLEGMMVMRNTAELIGQRLRATNERLVNMLRARTFAQDAAARVRDDHHGDKHE